MNDMNRKIFPENSRTLPVVVIGTTMHSRRTHMTDSDELDNVNDEADLLFSSGTDTDIDTLTARSEMDRKLLVGTEGGSSSSSDCVKAEYEDFYRNIPSLTHSGLAISNARKEKILKCNNKDPFEQQGMRTRIQAAAVAADGGDTMTAVVSGSYVTCSSDSESASERIKLFDGMRSDEEPSDLPGHWIELRTINSNRT